MLKQATIEEWLERLKGKGIVLAPINTIEKTFAHPQAVARKVTVEVEHPRAGKVDTNSEIWSSGTYKDSYIDQIDGASDNI